MKTQEELNEIKEEIEALNKKIEELTEEEMEQVAGGGIRKREIPKVKYCKYCGYVYERWKVPRAHVLIVNCSNCNTLKSIITTTEEEYNRRFGK